MDRTSEHNRDRNHFQIDCISHFSYAKACKMGCSCKMGFICLFVMHTKSKLYKRTAKLSIQTPYNIKCN